MPALGLPVAGGGGSEDDRATAYDFIEIPIHVTLEKMGKDHLTSNASLLLIS